MQFLIGIQYIFWIPKKLQRFPVHVNYPTLVTKSSFSFGDFGLSPATKKIVFAGITVNPFKEY